MRRFFAFLKRYIGFIPLLILIVVVVGLIAYFAVLLATQNDEPQIVPADVQVTAEPPPPPPIEPFAGVDPAVAPYLEQPLPDYEAKPLEILGANVPPVGVYLPREGNTQFTLPTATPRPTQPPTAVPIITPTLPRYPTSPPLPTALPSPTYDISIDLAATAVAFDAMLALTPPFLTVNDVCAPSGYPVPGYLTQRFHGGHSGVDLSASRGTPVIATHSATVTWAEWNNFGYGELIILQSKFYITYYAHLTSYNVSAGQFVRKGSIIGFSGSSGNSSGPHVHYETRIDDVPVDPSTFELRGLGTC